MNRKENSDSLPDDLMIEIFLRLPAKSIAKFHCVSKQWESILHRPLFKKLFLTRSQVRPRLLIALKTSRRQWSFFSSPQSRPQHSYEKSSLVDAADFHTKLRGKTLRLHYRENDRFSCCYASGLIHLLAEKGTHVIYNPISGQYSILPRQAEEIEEYSYIGYDPIDKQYKVLSMTCASSVYLRDNYSVMTLGNGEMNWRRIQCPLHHKSLSDGICINGVIYYLASAYNKDYGLLGCVIVRFDVRSEEFKFTEAECFRDVKLKLINYKGKLCGISWASGRKHILKLCVLEDVEEQEWSKYVYTLPKNESLKKLKKFVVFGMTARGEIVLSNKYIAYQPFYVFYFNPEKNTLQSVEIEGLDEHYSEVCAFVDHVEDLHVHDTKLVRSIEDLNTIRSWPNPQQGDMCNSSPFVKKNQPTIVMQNNKYHALASLELSLSDF